jgi:hypothetical protein
MRSGRSATRWLIIGSLAAGTVGAVLAIAGARVPLRLPLVLLFLSLAPALAARSWLGGLDRAAQVVIAGTSAIVVNFGVAETMIVCGVWSPRIGVAAVALVSALIAAIRLIFRQDADPETARVAVTTADPSDSAIPAISRPN